MKRHLLAIKQLDRQLASSSQLLGWFKPKEGWLRTIRKTLGMTTKQLAARLGVNRSRVVKIEQAELQNALTLRTLYETAEALDCKFFYILIPKVSLQQMIEQQARSIATKRLNRVAHSMSLEEQEVDPGIQNEQFEELVKELLNGPLKNLWNQE